MVPQKVLGRTPRRRRPPATQPPPLYYLYIYHRILGNTPQTGPPSPTLPKIPIKEANAQGGGDSRSPGYKKLYGDRCWELDSMNPDELRRLVRESIEPLITFDLQQKREEEKSIRDSFKRAEG